MFAVCEFLSVFLECFFDRVLVLVWLVAVVRIVSIVSVGYKQ